MYEYLKEAGFTPSVVIQNVQALVDKASGSLKDLKSKYNTSLSDVLPEWVSLVIRAVLTLQIP